MRLNEALQHHFGMIIMMIAFDISKHAIFFALQQQK